MSLKKSNFIKNISIFGPYLDVSKIGRQFIRRTADAISWSFLLYVLRILSLRLLSLARMQKLKVCNSLRVAF